MQRSDNQKRHQENAPSSRQIPLSLGKPSLRRRLEAYYSLISPQTIANPSEWLPKFDTIWDKFGGCVEGESRLSLKLSKKYGSAVRLLTVSSPKEAPPLPSTVLRQSEEWYSPRPNELGSGVVLFSSPDFDPRAALLLAGEETIRRFNPHMKIGPQTRLDNLAKAARYLLPETDPQRVVLPAKKKGATHPNQTKKKGENGVVERVKKIPVFSSLAARFSAGPLKVLHDAHSRRKRIRILVRYVDCVRGTLTGFVMAFDKHMNMILTDVDELYSPRVTQMKGVDVEGMSHAETEEFRRKLAVTGGNRKKGNVSNLQKMGAKRRHFKQLLVRGDNVVMIWKPDEEKSKLSNKIK